MVKKEFIQKCNLSSYHGKIKLVLDRGGGAAILSLAIGHTLTSACFLVTFIKNDISPSSVLDLAILYSFVKYKVDIANQVSLCLLKVLYDKDKGGLKEVSIDSSSFSVEQLTILFQIEFGNRQNLVSAS
jgi:hypothetical protein